MKKPILILLTIVLCGLIILVTLVKGVIFDKLSPNMSNNLKPYSKGEINYRVAILADSHVDYQRLKKSLEKAKKEDVNFVLHLGDLSDFGGYNELIATKKILDESGIEYLVIPGDRDVVEGGNNFKEIFSEKVCSDQLITKYKLVCFANPYNYTLLEDSYIAKFNSLILNAEIVVMSQPIYNPGSNLYMGYFSERVKNQAELVYKSILNSNTKYVIAGDAHYFKYFYDKNSGINYYNIGAVTDKRNLQSPNFAILSIYSSGFVEVLQKYID